MGFFHSADEKLCEKLANGNEAEFDGEDISPDVIRSIILGIDIKHKFIELRTISQSALRIKGARIAGRLDLDNISAPGGAPLPTIAFENCVFAGEVSFAHSSFSRISMENCRFAVGCGETPSINLNGCSVAGDLTLKELAPDGEDDCLWVAGHNARLDGDLILNGSRFRAPPRKREHLPIAERWRYAADFSGAEISGSVHAVQALEALGGITLKDSHVLGDVWLSGATLVAIEGQALNCQSARIDGSLMLDARHDREGEGAPRPFRAEGELWLLGVHIGSDLWICGARLWNPGANALNVAASSISRNMMLGGEIDQGTETRVIGAVEASALEVTGSVFVMNCATGVETNVVALALSGAKIHGGLEMFGYRPLVTGPLTRNKDAFFSSDPSPPPPGPEPLAGMLGQSGTRGIYYNSLLLAGARVGKLSIGALWHAESRTLRSTLIRGDIAADGLVIEGNCAVQAQLAGNASFAGLTVRNGSLNLSNLEFLLAANMILSDADISKTLQVSTVGQRATDARGPIAVRTIPLASAPGSMLVEALWSGKYPRATMHLVPQRALRQSWLPDWLRKRGGGDEVTTLAGTSRPFHELAESGAIQLETAEQAVELIKLFCVAVQGDDGAFAIIESVSDLPEGTAIDAVSTRSEIEHVRAKLKRLRDDGADEKAIAEAAEELDRFERLALITDLADIDPDLLRLDVHEQEGAWLISAALIYGVKLFRSEFKLGHPVAGGSLPVEMLGDVAISPVLHIPVAFRGKQIAREPQKDEEGKPVSSGDWPLRPTLPGMSETSPPSEVLERLLTPHSPDAAGLGRATVNLKDAQCDTLGDNGGLAWGDSFRVSLDRFTYRHAEGVGEASGASLLSLSPLSHWKVRREWLWQQMRGLNEPRNRRPRDLSEYKPQPFEQLIRVARSSGDEQMASSIEIEKNIIEGKIFAQASWRTFAALGVAGAAASALLNGVGTLLDVVLIVGIGLLVGFAPRIASFLFHWLFGYLRRPLRATLTLIGSIVIGFVGVHIANENYRMVIELTPTASTFDEAHARLGTPLNREGVASNMECGKEINELLYAIDVFIPLIDLRQEGRCTAGTVAGKETRSPEDQPAGWWARQMADAYARTILSQSFWEISKALYGVLGWIMVSLSILTFARLDRKSGQN